MGIRASLGALALVWTSIAIAQGPLPEPPVREAAATSPRVLSVPDLVEAHRRIAALELKQINWPLQNTAPRPSLEEYLPEEALVRRAEDPLRMSAALAALYDDPITLEQLQAELEREAVATKQPERLRELWAALGNDPALIAEAVARPILAENRLRARYYADETIHGTLRAQALAELSGLLDARELRTLSGTYREIEYRLVPEGEGDAGVPEVDDRGIERCEPARWQERIASLAERFGRPGAQGPAGLAGAVSGLRDGTEHFYVQGVLEAGPDRVRIGTMSWAKTPFTLWWEETGESYLQDGIACALEQPHPLVLPDVPQKIFHQPEGWEAITATGAPVGRKIFAWQLIGSVVVAWGGQDYTGAFLRSGGRYNPATDSWQDTSTGTNCPAAQLAESWAWTGTELVIWNGETQSGSRYNPATNTWTVMSSTGNPGHRHDYSLVWSGTWVILWGGTTGVVDYNTGGKYNPTTDTWTATATGANLPSARSRHTATWDVARGFMHIWGGVAGAACLNSGGIYNGNSTWYPMTSSGAPAAMREHTQVSYPMWGILVWGGGCPSVTDTGGWFDGEVTPPVVWHTITTTDAPSPRLGHAAIWGYNGGQMVIWGGQTATSMVADTGGRYHPSTNTWVPLPTTGAPSPRAYTKGVDLASEGLMMLVWGGANESTILPYDQIGGLYVLCSENLPGLQATPVTATDPNACTQGIQITWLDASSWHDSGYGTRSYEIYRDGALLATRSYGTNTYTDSATVNGTTYSYVVRYINGCGHSRDSAAVDASDSFGVAPSTLTNNTAVDTSGCDDTGVTVAWAANPGNWGDNGTGTRTYSVLRGGAVIAASVAYGTTSFNDTTGANGTSYNYQVRYNNGCGQNAITTGVAAADNLFASPSSLTNNTAADITACADTGVSVTWAANPGNWGDNGAGTRSYTVLRDGVEVAPLVAYGTTSYTDTTGSNGTSYSYRVRYNNGCGQTATTTGAPAMDFISTAPTASNNAAADLSTCEDSGVSITWSVPGNWNDNGSGTRSIDVLRGGTPIATGLAATATSYTDNTGNNGQSYDYTVRFKNGCNLTTTTTGASVMDFVSAAPTVSNNAAADLSACVDSGVSITWSAPGNWNDNGVGTRTIDVLRGGAPIATGLAATTTSYLDTTGANGTGYNYQVRFNNGCGSSATTGGASATDQVGAAPSGIANNTAADVSACENSGVSITWSAPGNWNDNGSGTRTIDVLRSGTPIVTGLAATATSHIDLGGVNYTTYSYQVRFNNGCNLAATTTGVSAGDYVTKAPDLSGNNTAADLSACADTGVRITWTLPSFWNDNGTGTRKIDIRRNGADLVTGLPGTDTSYTDTTGVNGTSYTYTVRFFNGCGLSATTAGASAADVVDTTPCAAVGSTLKITKSGPNASLSWVAVTCGDLSKYRVYGATSYNAPFPGGWNLLEGYSGPPAPDPLNSPYKAYVIVTVDNCGNLSGN